MSNVFAIEELCAEILDHLEGQELFAASMVSKAAARYYDKLNPYFYPMMLLRDVIYDKVRYPMQSMLAEALKLVLSDDDGSLDIRVALALDPVFVYARILPDRFYLFCHQCQTLEQFQRCPCKIHLLDVQLMSFVTGRLKTTSVSREYRFDTNDRAQKSFEIRSRLHQWVRPHHLDGLDRVFVIDNGYGWQNYQQIMDDLRSIFFDVLGPADAFDLCGESKKIRFELDLDAMIDAVRQQLRYGRALIITEQAQLPLPDVFFAGIDTAPEHPASANVFISTLLPTIATSTIRFAPSSSDKCILVTPWHASLCYLGARFELQASSRFEYENDE